MSGTKRSFTLLEVSKRTGVPLNSLRYHLKKVQSLFSNVKRDRFNRFRFVLNDIETLQEVHRLKQSGLGYVEILNLLENQTSASVNQVNSESQNTGPPQLQSEVLAYRSAFDAMQNRLEDMQKLVTQQSEKIESLEKRVALLVELHLKSLED
jgi:DNA-binding transcriptional MerR regulator